LEDGLGRVLITARSVAANQEGRTILESAGHEVVIHTGSASWGEDEMLRAIKGMDAAIVGLDTVTAKVLAAGAPRLKIIARNGVGYSNVDVKAAAALGIAVTLTPGTNSISVAELVIGLMLSLARHVPRHDAGIRQGGWSRSMGHELYGKTLGVIGTGHIGGEVIKRAWAFGMEIVAFDVRQQPELCRQYGVKYVSLEEVFRLADFLTLHVPATPETTGLINSRNLSLMKKSACVINTARGELVKEDDLCAALQSGVIAGFAADTLREEPPPKSHPLLSLENVVFTPHCGAYTAEAVSRASIVTAQEVVRVLAGEAPLYSISGSATRAACEPR
jgi:D-3-phosphoglycerate dehydrogenase